MSYRIHLKIVKKKYLDNHVSKKFGDSDEDYDKKWDFFNPPWNIELFNETPIEQFTIIKGYEDEEYKPYILSKNDVQKILDFYKEFLRDSFKDKQKEFDKYIENHKEKIDFLSISSHYRYLERYFDTLIKRKENISESGLFLLDYFYLVNIFDNMKEDEVAIITHG